MRHLIFCFAFILYGMILIGETDWLGGWSDWSITHHIILLSNLFDGKKVISHRKCLCYIQMCSARRWLWLNWNKTNNLFNRLLLELCKLINNHEDMLTKWSGWLREMLQAPQDHLSPLTNAFEKLQVQASESEKSLIRILL